MANEISGTIEYINAGSAKYAIAASAYGYCTTLANQPAKTVNMTGFILNKGVTIRVKFQYNNTASNPTLNINNTGAKPIVQYGNVSAGIEDSTTGWYEGAVISFTYDGTSWVRDQGFNTNTQDNYGNITTDGKIGTAAGLAVYTTTGGLITAGTLETDTPSASGTATAFITSVLQDSKGKISASKANLPTASSSTAGITKVGVSDGAAAYSHNHDASDINSGTLNTNRLPDDVVKKRTSLTSATTELDLLKLNPGIYDHTTNPNNLLPTSYGTILNIHGLYKYGALIAAETNNTLYHRAYYYNTDESWQWRGKWQMNAHADAGTAIGNATQPVYMASNGAITACTAYANASVNYATSAGSASTATEIEVTNAAPTSYTQYYLTYTTSTTTGNQNLNNSPRLYWYDNTDSEKTSFLCIGSPDHSGGLTIRNVNGKYANIITQEFDANRTLTLPNETGTFALLTKADINTLINLLDAGSSILTGDDYIITQSVGGGTTTKTYYRRMAKNVRVGGLTTAREIYVALDSARNTNNKVTFDGTADKAIHVNGTLGIGNGGTGKATDAEINTIFAGPTSGNSGAPSWRKLVDADIPNALTLTSITAAANMTISTATNALNTITISASSTLYLTAGANNQNTQASIVFKQKQKNDDNTFTDVNVIRLDTSNIFRPENNEGSSLGKSDKRWKNIYGTDIYGTNIYGDLITINPTFGTGTGLAVATTGTPWTNICFGSHSSSGTRYETAEQTNWGQIYFQAPVKDTSNNEFKYSARFFFRQYSKNKNSTTRGTYREDYYLPETDDDLSDNAVYGIRTSKDNSYSITGNAATATTLQTSRSLWGNSFNGSGNIDGTISLGDEKRIDAYITRKKEDGNGWAFTPLVIRDNANSDFAHIGVFGSANTLDYIYIGSNEYNKNNLRITSDGKVRIPVTTDASSKTTGALVVGGGAGFGGTVYASEFNGPLTGNAGTATKLAKACEIYVDLSSTRNTSNKVTFDGSLDKAIHVSGTLPIARGGTGKTTALEAITNLGGPYLNACGTEITASSNLDSDYKAMGTYYSTDSNRTATLTGTVPTSSSGFKMITAIGYSTANLMQFLKGYNNPLMYRSSVDTGATWTKWYQFVLLPSGSDNKTFADIGNATTPVYVNSSGIITAGTALGGAAYKAANYYATTAHTHGWADLTDNADSLSSGDSNCTASTEILTSYASNNGFSDTDGKGKVYRRKASAVVNATLVKAALGTVSTTETAGKFLKDTGSWTKVAWEDLDGKPSTFTPSSHSHTGLVHRLSSVTKGSNPASIAYGLGSWAYEAGTGTEIKNRLFGLEGNVNTSGRSFMQLIAYENTANSTTTNRLGCWIDKGGEMGYTVSNPEKFRAAIEAAAASHNHDDIYVNKTGDTMVGTGTATTEQWVTLIMGNNKAVDTAGNYSGQIRIYDNLGHYQQLRSARSALTDDRTVYLPAKDATCYLVDTTGTGASGSWGISITGNAATATSAAIVNSYNADFDAKQSNNGGTTYYKPTFTIYDTNSLLVGYCQSQISSNGNISTILAARNWDTTGTTKKTNALSITIAKDGTCTYSVSNPENFRAAIGAAASNSDYCTLSTAQTFTGNKTFNSICYFANGTTYYVNKSGTAVFNAVTVKATTASTSTSTGALIVKGGIGAAGDIYGAKVYNAVWNDYAECREVETEEPGYCVTETSNGCMIKTTKRLQPGCKITSDTFGTCMGETDKAKTPIAVAGRVLAYPYRNRSEYCLGAAVCSAPNGTVDIMTREEIMAYPERIVGTVSEIPTYEVWHGGNQDGKNDIFVNGRIWIYVR